MESFRPSHEAPPAGLPAWSAPDPRSAAEHTLEPGLPVELLESTTGWARVRCSNGWECWVDASTLVPLQFRPTHSVPAGGLDYRPVANATAPAAGRLDPGLPVVVVEQTMGWARVQCSNGWETWVDGQAFVAGASSSTTGATGAIALPTTTAIAVIAGGAVVALLGTLLAWFSAAGSSANGWDFDVVTLFNHEFTDDSPLTPGLVVVVLGALAVAVALFARPLPRLAVSGIGAVVVLVGALGLGLYFDLPEPRPDLGAGILLTIVGGGAIAAGGLFASPGVAKPSP